MSELPQNLISEIQKYTNAPWWNGGAYADFKGYPGRISRMEKEIGDAVDDIADVMEWLRSEKQFDKADRLRTIAGRLARLQQDDESYPIDSLRRIAKDWK